MNQSGSWKRRLLPPIIGLLLSLFLLLSRDSFSKAVPAERLKDLSDAFFVPGALLACVGALVFVAGNGIFDMVNYGVIKVLSLVRSESHRAAIPRTYYEYVQGKAGRSGAGAGPLLAMGAAFLALSAVFALLISV